MSNFYQITALSALPKFDKPVKLGIVGSRFFTDYSLLESYIVFLYGQYDIRYIVSGGKRRDGAGVDTLAEIWADNNQEDKIIYPPKLKRKNGHQAYFDRNEMIAKTSDILLAVKDEIVGGTLDTVKRMLEKDKPVLWGNYNKEIKWVKSLT